MNMKKSISILMAVFIVSLSVSAQTWQPADPDATPEAKTTFHTVIEYPIQRNYVRASG